MDAAAAADDEKPAAGTGRWRELRLDRSTASCWQEARAPHCWPLISLSPPPAAERQRRRGPGEDLRTYACAPVAFAAAFPIPPMLAPHELERAIGGRGKGEVEGAS
jgi:hypothetical protein